MTPDAPMPDSFAASAGSALTAFQRKILDYVKRGYGPSAAPREYTAQQRRELADLLERGLVRVSKNHSQDKHGAYSTPHVGISDSREKPL